MSTARRAYHIPPPHSRAVHKANDIASKRGHLPNGVLQTSHVGNVLSMNQYSRNGLANTAGMVTARNIHVAVVQPTTFVEATLPAAASRDQKHAVLSAGTLSAYPALPLRG